MPHFQRSCFYLYSTIYRFYSVRDFFASRCCFRFFLLQPIFHRYRFYPHFYFQPSLSSFTICFVSTVQIVCDDSLNTQLMQITFPKKWHTKCFPRFIPFPCSVLLCAHTTSIKAHQAASNIQRYVLEQAPFAKRNIHIHCDNNK